ncbi:DUF1223 domain-containing protein [Marinobacterium sp. D7]|uniref:DUF1223 domain-containing protein n=1 Tax=Marinobacterium ramblicola TaxID=2849041 RepID=UPI001C2CD456|nr:DUF1223 domain-containing protein [Marinobacterium ramblicola]MBV1788428.1 DUF1223 domain-containing protein [Marinobacterium ramblicola]
MKLLIGVVLCYLPALPVAAETFHSSPGSTLVELYTSEGCSSCPPADRWLRDLGARPELFKTLYPVAFHVDYWNRLGWADRFSSAEFSARQRDYARQGLISQAYTPGFVVNGREWSAWFRGPRQLPGTTLKGAELVLEYDRGKLSAVYSGADADSLTLNLAYLGMGLSSEVSGGENRGRRLEHDFVVLGFWQQDSDRGEWLLSLPRPQAQGQSRTALVAWVTAKGDMLPRQVAGGYLD